MEKGREPRDFPGSHVRLPSAPCGREDCWAGEGTGRSEPPAPAGHTARPLAWPRLPVVPINPAQAGNPRGFACLCNGLSYAEEERGGGGQEKGRGGSHRTEQRRGNGVCLQRGMTGASLSPTSRCKAAGPLARPRAPRLEHDVQQPCPGGGGAPGLHTTRPSPSSAQPDSLLWGAPDGQEVILSVGRREQRASPTGSPPQLFSGRWTAEDSL